jgi:hypothetical protein
MAIRYIDTGFYKSPFVRSLKGQLKSFYNFVITDCSGAGIWAKDLEVASLFTGFAITDEDFGIFVEKGKAIDLGNGKYLFPDFIEHQYPQGLSDKNPAQKNFIFELRKYNLLEERDGKLTLNKDALKGLITPNGGVALATMVTVMVTDKVDVTETVTVEKPKNAFLDLLFLEFKNIKIKPFEFEKLCTEFTQEITEKAIKYLSAYKIEKGYKTKSDYLTIRRWVIDAVKKQNTQNGNTENKPGKPESYGGIEATSFAKFLGVSTDELSRLATNGG